MTSWKPGLRPDLVLFDLDGTLSDSASGIIASMRHAFDVHGMPQPDDATMQTFVGPPFGTALTEMGLSADQVEQVVATYRADYNAGRLFDNELFPGIVELLEELRRAGIESAVATSKPQATARRIVEHFDLAPLLAGGLESVFGADVDHPGDSKADVIGRALAALVHDASAKVVMVGDRLHDVHGAGEHSIPCVGVAWGYAQDDELDEAGAVTVVETPRALADLLLGRH